MTPDELEAVAEWCPNLEVHMHHHMTIEHKSIGSFDVIISRDNMGIYDQMDSFPDWFFQAIYEALEEEGLLEEYHQRLCKIVSPWFFEDMDESTSAEKVSGELGRMSRECITATPTQKFEALEKTLDEAGVL